MADILNIPLEKTNNFTEKENKYPFGLSTSEAKRRLETCGENILTKKKKNKTLKIFAGQFHDAMVMILLVAAGISVILGRYMDAIPIILIVIINAFLGFIQEFRCEKTLEKLEEMTSPMAKVYREGELLKIKASQVVPGDIVSIEAGDKVPCDGFVIKCKSLICDESVLTGESLGIEKNPRTNETEFTTLGKDYMTYMGSVVLKGNGLIEAVSTGERTQMGIISKLIEDVDPELTPLQKKLGELGKVLAIICIGVCILVFFAGIVRGEPIIDMAMTGISIAIAAIPEGLPATVTIALAIAVRKMLKRNALVHKLHSVETLGCTTVICTDKTGTITQNKMTVTEIIDSIGVSFAVDERMMENCSNNLIELVNCAVLCNNAVVEKIEKVSFRNRNLVNPYACQGDPTEAAILSACLKLGVDIQNIGYNRVDEIPFESENRSMTVICRNEEGVVKAFLKGASDVIVNNCEYKFNNNNLENFTATEKLAIFKAADRCAKDGLRVIAFEEISGEKRIFLGLMAMEDPPRPEAAKAVAECSQAGIRTVMITGDHKLTAQAIAGKIGILKNGGLTITGKELDAMNDSDLLQIIDNCSVFARVTPAHKLRIVRAFKAKGNICAMTGDGVNDAPAIKEADIGVSMGIQGTEVTKQAADVILLDDNFATLVNAVEEGRGIYQNIRKFVRYLISCNIGEVLTMLGGIIMGLPMVLLPSQILLVNLVTDSLPALALGLESPENSIMKKPPRKENDSFFSDGLLFRIISRGFLIGITTLGTFTIILKDSSSIEMARTGALVTLVMSQLIHVFECKSEEKSLFSINYLSNPFLLFSVAISAITLFLGIYFTPLQKMFSTTILSIKHLIISLVFSIIVPIIS